MVVDIVPDTGLAGTVITIVGRDFTGATAVTFGAGAASFNVLNDRKIEATTPVQTRGRIVDIIVITPDGTSRNTDDDDFTYRVPHLVIDQGDGLAVSEDGDSDTYTLALDLLPTGTVTVSIPDTDDLAISPNTFVFTTSDYAVPRRVTVSAVDDVHSESTHTALIKHYATGGGYGSAGEHPLAVTVTDNDRFVIVVTQPGGRTNLLEGGRPAFLSVRLSADPGDDATVTVTGDDQLTTSTSTVSFGRENWGTPVEFAVLATDDDLSEGDHTGTLTLTLSGPRVLPPVLEVTIFISDEHSPAVHIAESGGGTTVAEAGGQDTYTLALARQPVGPVTVSIRPEDDLRSSPAQIVFRPDNWDQPQTVTVEAIDDALIEGDQVHHIHHVATRQPASTSSASVLLGVSIIDNDTPDHALRAALGRSLPHRLVRRPHHRPRHPRRQPGAHADLDLGPGQRAGAATAARCRPGCAATSPSPAATASGWSPSDGHGRSVVPLRVARAGRSRRAGPAIRPTPPPAASRRPPP